MYSPESLTFTTQAYFWGGTTGDVAQTQRGIFEDTGFSFLNSDKPHTGINHLEPKGQAILEGYGYDTSATLSDKDGRRYLENRETSERYYIESGASLENALYESYQDLIDLASNESITGGVELFGHSLGGLGIATTLNRIRIDTPEIFDKLLTKISKITLLAPALFGMKDLLADNGYPAPSGSMKEFWLSFLFCSGLYEGTFVDMDSVAMKHYYWKQLTEQFRNLDELFDTLYKFGPDNITIFVDQKDELIKPSMYKGVNTRFTDRVIEVDLKTPDGAMSHDMLGIGWQLQNMRRQLQSQR
jgi:hypothetical protein